MYMCALRNQRLIISLLPQSLSTLFWGAGLLMNTELTNWMNYLAPELPESPISTHQHWDYRNRAMPDFYLGAGI